MRLARSLLLLALLVTSAECLVAQEPGLIRGRVLDDASGAAVAGANVELLTLPGRMVRRTIADASGSFVLPVPRDGTFVLSAVRVGYGQARSAPVGIHRGDTLDVILRMNIEAVLLPALEVVASSRIRHPDPGIEGFRLRTQRDLGGTSITRDQIEQRGPGRVSDLLHHAGLNVWGNGIAMRRTGCAPMVYIDGIAVTYPHMSNGGSGAEAAALEAVNMVHPSSIEGIEVYRGGATLPAELGGSTGQCGVVFIWTKRGR